MDTTDNYTKIKELVFDSFIQSQCDAVIESFLFDYDELDSAMESEESVKRRKNKIDYEHGFFPKTKDFYS